MIENKQLTIILLSYFSSRRILEVYKKVSEHMAVENVPLEFIIIDDGSEDDSYQIACELEQNIPRVRAFQLSKNYTSHYAIFAGLSVSKGSCATLIPDDMQMPLDTIVRMYRLWEKGEKVIIPFRKSRNDGKINDFFSNIYYNVMNSISEVKFPEGGADSFLIDREIIDLLNDRISPLNTSSIVEVLRLGFNPVYVPFERPKKIGKSRWTFRKKLRLALDTLLSSSSFPIKFIVLIGIFSVILSFFLILSGIIIRLFFTGGFLGFSIPGWTTNFILISFYSGLILFALGIISEYVWRIYEEVKGRPAFIIRKKEKPAVDEKKKEESNKD